MHLRNSRLTVLVVLSLAAALSGCGEAAPPPPVTPAGVVLPPEVELSPEEAVVQNRPQG